MHTVSGRVVQKYTTKGTQIMNGEYLFMDLPFRRPTVYHLQIEGGHTTTVSKAKYDATKVGDIVAFETLDGDDYQLLLRLTIFFAVLLVVVLLLLAQ